MSLTTNDRARVDALIERMSLQAKLAQLVGAWIGIDSTTGEVAPAQNENMPTSPDWETLARTGLGHITRLYGTRPIDPTEGRAALRRMQADLRRETGVGAIAHEEVLTGVASWRSTTYPSPPAYGATWDPALLEEVGAAIAESMRALEVHQGLAPLLDVVYDARWGRTEECFGEDPYLVGTLGAAYVRGLEQGGVVATLKHFVGYPASQGGRNLGPVHVGPRELAELLLYPFEVALREGGARAVMPSYSEIDGVPVHGDAAILTELLRDMWGFTGTVVADYFGVNFLETLHGVSDGKRALVEAVLETGTKVVLVLVTGRPYALDWAVGRAAAIVQAWFPGQEGAAAVAGVLSGRINPSGRTTISFPRSAGMMPTTYRHVRLAGKVGVTNLDPTPVFPFGHGLSYTTFERSDLRLSAEEIATDGTVEVSVRVRNTGDRAGADVVQLYVHDVVAPVTRPEVALLGYARVALEPGEERQVTWRVAADRLAWVDTDLEWTVAPHRASLSVGSSSANLELTARLAVTGPVRKLGPDRVLTTPVTVA